MTKDEKISKEYTKVDIEKLVKSIKENNKESEERKIFSTPSSSQHFGNLKGPKLSPRSNRISNELARKYMWRKPRF